MTCNPKILPQPRPTRYIRCVFQGAEGWEWFASGSWQKTKVCCEERLHLPWFPPDHTLPFSQVPPAVRHRAGAGATPSPCTHLNPILAITSHLLGSAEHNYKRVTLNLLFKLMLILHQLRWGAEVQNISFSILCYKCQFCPCICILYFIHRFNSVRFHELHLASDVQ